jgi:hypothetical protein
VTIDGLISLTIRAVFNVTMRRTSFSVVVQFERRFVSGLRFSDAAEFSQIPNGFSHFALALPLKRHPPEVVVRLRARPDTNRFSNCTTTRFSEPELPNKVFVINSS